MPYSLINQSTNFLIPLIPKCFHEQPVFEHLGYEYGDFPKSEKASREVLSLPMHPFLSDDEQKEISEKLIELL